MHTKIIAPREQGATRSTGEDPSASLRAGYPPLHFILIFSFEGLDHYELAHGASVLELDAAGDFGEEGVVFAAAYVEAGLYTGATLADDDSAAGDNLSAKCFKAEPLGIGVAAISGAA
jgi:hypothetical protein